MLNYSSRDTEKRIVEELERIDPPVAEEVKRGTFVFEDFCLFDEGALSLVVAELGEELFARGLSACESRERGMVLARLGSPARARVEALVASLASPPSLSRAAQEEAVALARRLDLEGRIKVLRGEEAGPAGVLLTLAE
jgi:flagellar motor switch protein FliG